MTNAEEDAIWVLNFLIALEARGHQAPVETMHGVLYRLQELELDLKRRMLESDQLEGFSHL